MTFNDINFDEGGVRGFFVIVLMILGGGGGVRGFKEVGRKHHELDN